MPLAQVPGGEDSAIMEALRAFFGQTPIETLEEVAGENPDMGLLSALMETRRQNPALNLTTELTGIPGISRVLTGQPESPLDFLDLLDLIPGGALASAPLALAKIGEGAGDAAKLSRIAEAPANVRGLPGLDTTHINRPGVRKFLQRILDDLDVIRVGPTPENPGTSIVNPPRAPRITGEGGGALMSPQGLERARDRAWSIGASERGIGSRPFEFSPLEDAGIVMDPSRLRASPAKQLGLLEEGTAGTLRHEAMHNVLYSLDRNTQRALAELPEVQKAGMEALTDKYGVRGTFTYIANQTTGPLHEVALKITNTIPGGIRKLEDAPPEFFEGLSLLQPRLNSPSAVRAFVADVMNASSRVRETMMQELFAIAAENNSMRHIPDAVPQELREELGQVISLINSKLR